MWIGRGTGECELSLSVRGGPICIILCRGLSLKVWIIKRRGSADHVRRRMSRISRTGRMTWKGIRGGGRVGGGRVGRERPRRVSRVRRWSR